MATDEQRISRLEGAYEQVDARLADINNRLDSMSNRMDAMEAHFSARMDAMEAKFDARFNTQLVLTVGSWVTIMAAIIAVFFTT